MNNITEFTDTTSEHELFAFLYEKVVNREITVFSKLKEFAAPVLRNPRTHPVLMKLFELLKKLNWGFFENITPETHKRLWRELVIPDKQFPDAGDLKTTLQISNLYIAMLDIHGYTQFCMDSRKNLSMMHTLDWAINKEIGNISTKCHAVSQRERGDEIVVIAASATDALMVTLCIIDYFGKTNTVDDPNVPTKRTGPVLLPILSKLRFNSDRTHSKSSAKPLLKSIAISKPASKNFFLMTLICIFILRNKKPSTPQLRTSLPALHTFLVQPNKSSTLPHCMPVRMSYSF